MCLAIIHQNKFHWSKCQSGVNLQKKKSKCELTGIKAILVGGVTLKAEQWDIGAIVEYPLEAKVTILAGYYSSLKMVLWLDTPLCQVVGYSSKEQLAIACAARRCFDECIHIPFILGPVGAISQCGCLPPVMGNDMEAENSVSGRGYN